jgi:hypothetical protein
MSNVAGKAYAINAITPMRPWLTWLNEFSFMFARSKPSTLVSLLGLSFIHFARWVIVRRDQWPDLGQGKQNLKNDYLLFCSNFNGTWDQYIDAFADGFPSGLDFFWTTSTKYPQSVPITPFKNYIRVNQADTDYYYNATPGAGQWDVKAALRVRRELLELAEEAKTLTPEEFRKSYVSRLLKVQHDLGAQGYAPIASNDTFLAERKRNGA